MLKRLLKVAIPVENFKPISLVANKYISHIIIIILVIGVTFINFFSPEIKAEGFGEKSVLFALAAGETLDAGYIEETIESSQPQLTSYLETQTTAVTGITNILTKEEAPAEEAAIISDDSGTVIKPELTSIEAAKKSRDKIIEYVVESGDTISTIAEKFSVSVNTILWENDLSAFSLIKPGQKLTILPTSGLAHKVIKGETLASIAKKFKSDTEKIIAFNKLLDEDDIQINQVIIIPEGQPYYAPVEKKTQLASVKKIFTPTHVDVPAGDKMAWPSTARRISQYFNWRHKGLDIDGEFGDPIWAADDGVVTKVAYLNYGYGYHVFVDHGNGKQTRYAHFQKIYVQQGQAVARGDVLGEMGSTGMSTGSHLHFEVRFDGTPYNPLSYIK